MRKLALQAIVLLLLFIPLITSAQTTVSGKVVDQNGKPVNGASVILKGKSTGTRTDANGNFSIKAAKGDVIVISSINFVAQSIKVKDATTINVSLAANDATLGEVVVTAMDIKRN
ncbi:MAG TPA: carboxypeptidase-like regulatory domain-containing protein, partial [Ferruginibacter sp.]|nr:carboxypeptidase-like regulatory domain-containing protein [Ferruginibacter sp.]